MIADMFAKLNEKWNVEAIYQYSRRATNENVCTWLQLWAVSRKHVLLEIMTNLQAFASSPVHSMILDVSDKSWLKYFTPGEIQETKNHQKRKFL